MSTNVELLGMLAAHLILTALPAVFGVFLAMRRGVASLPLLLAIGLLASGVTAMLAFWAYYAAPVLGQAFAFLLVLGSLQGIFLCWRAGLDRDLLRQLATPLALWVLGSAFVLFFGFLHGGGGEPLRMAAERFSHSLPYDNDIPNFFADWFYAHGHHGPPPPIGDWLSSDRPPLQIGYVLAQRPFGWDGDDLHYQVLGVVIQQLWIVGMWAVLCAARLRPLARSLTICAAMASDIAILHGFYVWPKLIAAAFLLAAFAIVISADWTRLRHDPWIAAFFAVLCGLAMLAHGSSAFFLIALLGAAAWRGLPDWRWLGVAALVGIGLLAPWVAYQRLADPPGDRLVKWHLGGSLELDDRGTLETIADGYGDAGLGGVLDNKWRNVTEIVGTKWTGEAVSAAVDDVGASRFGMAAGALRTPRFFSLLPLLGILLLGPIAMAVARVRERPAGPEWSFALLAFAFCGLACLVWVLLMFGSEISATTTHVGPLAVPLLAIAACVAGAFAVSSRLAIILVGLNLLFVLALYTPSLIPQPDTSYSLFAGLLAATSLAGFGFVALRVAWR